MRWNNVWLADRGYAVLNYTARGHEGSEGSIQLASKDFEVRDTRYLTGLLADDSALRIDPRHVAAVGGSYGGGQAWLLLTTREDARLQYGEWRSPGGRIVRLAAVVPQYTWSDLLYSLAPSGHHLSGGVDPASATTPFGVGKLTLRERLPRHDRRADHPADRVLAGALRTPASPTTGTRRSRRPSASSRSTARPSTRTASSARCAPAVSAACPSSSPRGGPIRSSRPSRRCECTGG